MHYHNTADEDKNRFSAASTQPQC